MTAKQKRSVVALCISFAMVQASVALYAAFMTLYLEDMGFNAAQRGVLLALGPCVAILTQTMWGSVADRAKNKVRVVAVMAAGIALAGALFLLADLPIIGASGRITSAIIVLALVLLIFFQNPVQPLVDTLVLEYIRNEKLTIPFGRMRTWGTAAFAACAYFAGLAIEATAMGIKIIFWILIALMVIQLAALVLVPPIAGMQKKEDKTPVWSLFRDKWFTLILASSFVVAVGFGYHNFSYANYICNQLGASESVVGISTSVQCILEIFLFIYMHKIIKKTGILNLLLVCLVSGALRWLAMGTITSIPVLIGIQFFLHPFTWPIMLYVMSIYIQKTVPAHLNARGQTIANMFLASVARAVGSLGGGVLVEHFGDGAVPAIFTGLGLFTFVILFAVMMLLRRWGWGFAKTPEALKLEENTVI